MWLHWKSLLLFPPVPQGICLVWYGGRRIVFLDSVDEGSEVTVWSAKPTFYWFCETNPHWTPVRCVFGMNIRASFAVSAGLTDACTHSIIRRQGRY